MRRKFLHVTFISAIVFTLFAPVASAELFGSDDKKMEMILREIKKVNTRIMEKVLPSFEKINQAIAKNNEEIKKLKADILLLKSEINRIKSGNKNLIQQMDILANVIPAIQASMEQGQAQTLQQVQTLGKDMGQLESRIQASQIQQEKNQKAGLEVIKQEVASNLQILKEGMARDMEQMAKLNQGFFQEMVKSNEKYLNEQNERINKFITAMTEIAKGGSQNREMIASIQTNLNTNNKTLVDQNKKIIDILSKSLKEQESTSQKMDKLEANQNKSNENVRFTREAMTALKTILDKRLVEIDKTQQALLTQNDKVVQSTDLVHQNLLVADQKINKLAEGLKAIQTDKSFAELVDTTKKTLVQVTAVNQKIDSSMMKLDEGKTEINLTSEKMTKLIEILKAIAEEQGKLEQLVATHAGKDYKAMMKALDDLKRKANVNISRNDSILKKLKGSKK